MIKKFKEWLGLCNHKWVIFRTVDIVDTPGTMPVGVRHEMQCEHCGKLKRVKWP